MNIHFAIILLIFLDVTFVILGLIIGKLAIFSCCVVKIKADRRKRLRGLRGFSSGTPAGACARFS